MPYTFDNTVITNDSLTINGSVIINDTIKLGSTALGIYGEYAKYDTLPDGTVYLTSDTVPFGNTSLPYDSITSSPFSKSDLGQKWYSVDSGNTYSFGGINDTSTASLFVKSGIENGVIVLPPDETQPEGADIYITSANTVATNITTINANEQGRYITVIGGSNTNSTTIASGGNIILTGADPITMSETMAINFITYWRSGQVYLLELKRNQ